MNKLSVSQAIFTLLLIATIFITACNDNSQDTSTTQTDTTTINKDTTTTDYNPAQAPVTNSQY